jgi:threonylcarbamoyladenosine tRNA methylthiotransferase MtaB
VVTLGCKVNQAESEALTAELAGRGVRATADEAPAVVVVNTCTVTGEADAKSRKAIRRALALPGSPTVVVTGCLAAIDGDSVAALGERVRVEADKALVAPCVAELAAPEAGTSAPLAAPAPARTRVQVKIQDGCDAFCTYCIVPHARGGPRSVSAGDVVDEVARLRAAGLREVVLTGINIGRYADGDARLPELVRRVADTGIARIRISSIEPDDVTDELLDVVRATPAVVGHLHVPLQSGSDRTLEEMGRRYDTASYAATLARVRSALPQASVTTDLLVGFPGETDEDFERTLAFVRACGFARLHVFRYSARPGTPAAERSEQVPAHVRTARGARLRELGAELAAAWVQDRLGGEATVLVERVTGSDAVGGRAEGTSEDYLRVAFHAPPEHVRPGDIVRVGLVRSGDGRVEGRLLR